MNHKQYNHAAALQAKATVAANDFLRAYWDSMLETYKHVENGECIECGREGTNDWCETCNREIEYLQIGALDPLAIEDDGRIILGFGGPNIWIDANDQLCYAWWDATIRSVSPSPEHDAMLETFREEIGELS